MKTRMLVQGLVAVALLVLLGWVVTQTRWVEEQVDDDPRGEAATDPHYSLRRVLEGAGATLQVHQSLDELPPSGATLVLDSTFWNIFPEREARLQAWVEGGGHLVIGRAIRGTEGLAWIPLSFTLPRRHRDAEKPDAAASGADDGADDQDVPAARRKPDDTDRSRRRMARILGHRNPWHHCADYRETDATTQPAYEPGRTYGACGYSGRLHLLNHATPTWVLEAVDTEQTLAIRVPVGRGTVTGVTPAPVLDNNGLLQKDNALVAAAVLQAAPGRAVWIVEDEKREPLAGWMWQQARAPTLLALAAIALALWRLMVRFGPRTAPPTRARRSMGEQVRGTGRFIAATDPRALHAATRQAFDDAARRRVEDWGALPEDERIAALAAALAHSHAIDQPLLRQSLNLGPGATPAQIVAAIAVLEQARRMLLATPPAPTAS